MDPLSTASDANGVFTFDVDMKSDDVIKMLPSAMGKHNGAAYDGELLKEL